MFTFKTEKPTGRYRSFSKDCTYIKVKRQQVGLISELDYKCYAIRLMVESKIEKCGWTWIQLKAKFESVQEAKDFCNQKFELINKSYKLVKH